MHRGSVLVAALALCAIAIGCEGEIVVAEIDGARAPGDQPGAVNPGDVTPDVIDRPDDDPIGDEMLQDVCATVNPGDTPLHRLTQREYTNAIRDLFPDLSYELAPLPTDEKVAHFDANTVTGVSELLAELYQTNSEVVSEAFAAQIDTRLPCASAGEPQLVRVEAESLQGTAGQVRPDSWLIWSNGHVETVFQAESAGTYTLRVRAWASQAGTDLANMQVHVNSREVGNYDVEASAGNPAVFDMSVELTEGAHTIRVSFTNDLNSPETGMDRNLWVDYIEVEGQGQATVDVSCAIEFGQDLAKRAWRRPLTQTEVSKLQTLYSAVAAQDGPREGVRALIEGILQSPRFIYRLEAGQGDQAIVALDDHELAARLSFFLWDSIPDEPLMLLADTGQLSKRAVLQAQARRMLQDDRARHVVNQGVMQLLGLDGFRNIERDDPAFTPEVRAALEAEFLALIDEVIWDGDGKISSLLTADFAYVSKQTAQFYGVEPPAQEGMHRVTLDRSTRQGILTHPVVLAKHGFGEMVVHRGLFVRETFYCKRPAPPPDELINPPQTYEGQPERDKAQGRLDHLGCGGCHQQMDPLGLVFDQFDETGRHRMMDRHGNAVESFGEILQTSYDNQNIAGPVVLSDVLADSAEVQECLSEQWLRFALGRYVTTDDECSRAMLDQAIAESGDSVVDLFVALALTDAFRYRRSIEQ